MAELTPESWTALLRWLDGNEAVAADRYESIRRRLTKLFSWRGCPEPDRLADITIDRVARRVAEGAAAEAADPY